MRSVSKLIIIIFFLYGCSEDVADTGKKEDLITSNESAATYTGADTCISCHQDQYNSWQGSHHDLAMQPANNKTVLGNFNNTTFNYFGTVSTFYKKDNLFFVKTDGPDGKLTDYPIAYSFGVFPLQQYLIKFPGGRYQVLSIAWDTRSKEQGGQRWFHLYPDEHIKHDDELHWTGINQNWNHMCADCHSTNLQKNYDHDSKTYNTSWSDIDVTCEACHGPGSKHLDWTRKKDSTIKNKGLSIAYNERQDSKWTIDTKTGNARRNHTKVSNTEIEACAQCHSRRLTSFPDPRPEHALLDNYQVSLLTEPLYHADGQINGEVYVYGSFVQSKMYHAGVTCSDCHQPHSLKLRAEGNNLCAQCHLPDKYNNTDHHMHQPGTEGSQCINCHMPSKTYMVVDPRRDHSFRIPRPDLTMRMDVPNACTQCHNDKTAQWAAGALKQKFGDPRPHYADALYAGRNRLPDAPGLLSKLVLDNSQPAIARATAVTLLGQFLTRETAQVFQIAANDEQPLVGFGLATILDAIPTQQRLPFAYPLLYDDSRTTRALAARALAGISLENLPAEGTTKFNQALQAYKTSQLFNADRPESLVNLAGLYTAQGNTKQAKQYYQEAISLAPWYTPAYINFADLYRSVGNDEAGETVLRKALSQVTDKTAIQHTLGLLLVRQKNMSEAITYLGMAAQSPTTTDRYMYVYAIALNSVGKSEQALNVLEQAHSIFPTNTNILSALVSINRETGNQERAQHFESMLQNLLR